MNKSSEYVKAKERLRQLQWFYVHAVGYLVVVGLIMWNFLVIEDTKYTDTIIVINITTLFVWGVAVVLHAIKTLYGSAIFERAWEAKKIKKYLKKDDKTWE